MELYDLRVNHLCNPLGYEMNKTVFSWKVKNAVGKKQEAARIRIGELENFETLIMDTGFSKKSFIYCIPSGCAAYAV